MPGALPNNQTWTAWDFNLRISANKVPYIAGVSKYGYNPAVIDVKEDIWANGGVLQFLSSAETLEIASTDAADDGDPVGTGARTISIFGLDANYMPISEEIVMNGTTDVTTTKSYLRVNRMRAVTAGSNGTNVGTISATATTAGTVQAAITADAGATLKSQYTVPAGYYAFIRTINYGALNNDQVEFDLQTRNEGAAWVTRDRLDTVEGFIPQPFQVPIRVAPKADIRVQGVRATGSGTLQLSTRYEMHLVKEEYVNTNSIVVDET